MSAADSPPPLDAFDYARVAEAVVEAVERLDIDTTDLLYILKRSKPMLGELVVRELRYREIIAQRVQGCVTDDGVEPDPEAAQAIKKLTKAQIDALINLWHANGEYQPTQPELNPMRRLLGYGYAETIATVGGKDRQKVSYAITTKGKNRLLNPRKLA